MRNLDSLLVEYCEHLVNTYHRSGYSGENIIHKILNDPGISTQGSRHRVLWWPPFRGRKQRRIYDMGRAFHRLDILQRMCLIVEYGRIVDPDNGQIVDAFTFSQDQPDMGLREFDRLCRKAKTKLSRILKT